jgi:hypothetical protein
MSWSIVAIALLWGILENCYFGWNWLPGSDAELIADGIGFLLWALAFGRRA